MMDQQSEASLFLQYWIVDGVEGQLWVTARMADILVWNQATNWKADA